MRHEARIASIAAATEPRPAISALSAKLPDAILYKSIFRFAGKPANGNAPTGLSGKSDDTGLNGPCAVYQRYMHPTAYRARWTELRDWLKNYADQPGAWRVYKLAQKRKPRGVSMPKRPPERVYFNERAIVRPAACFRTRTKRAASKIALTWLVRRERPTQALKYISQKKHKTAV